MDTTGGDGLTTTNLLARASEVLEQGEYARVVDEDFGAEDPSVRYFEDDYGIVSVSVYETWDALWSGWRKDEAELSQIISKHWSRSDPKAWDGYLVLLTPGRAGVGRRSEISSLRYNTSTVRKLVGSSDEMEDISDVEDVLLPLLPLNIAVLGEERTTSSLDRLAALLGEGDYSAEAVRTLVSAFRDEEQLMESLHSYLAGQE